MKFASLQLNTLAVQIHFSLHDVHKSNHKGKGMGTQILNEHLSVHGVVIHTPVIMIHINRPVS